MLTSEVHPSGVWWDLPELCIPLPGAPGYSAALFLPQQPSFSLRSIVTKGSPPALLGMQDVLPGRLQTPVGPLCWLSNPCATNPWKTARERGLTSWVLALLVAVSSNKVPQEKVCTRLLPHSKSSLCGWCFRKQVTPNKLHGGGLCPDKTDREPPW